MCVVTEEHHYCTNTPRCDRTWKHTFVKTCKDKPSSGVMSSCKHYELKEESDWTVECTACAKRLVVKVDGGSDWKYRSGYNDAVNSKIGESQDVSGSQGQ